MTTTAASGHPDEGGGVLLGVLTADGRPWITKAVTVASSEATGNSYVLPGSARPRTVDRARKHDDRLGYLGDWHSHPADLGPSAEDSRTMRRLARTTPGGPNPVLIIARRLAEGGYAIDARESSARRLRRLEVLAAGDLATPNHFYSSSMKGACDDAECS
jgi:proteasome lid subunit RPN8/RPN11